MFTQWYFYYIFIATFMLRKAINAPTHTFLETTTDEINTTPTFNEMCLEGFIQSSNDSNKCYKYFSEPKSWTVADFECQKYGGHLVSVHSSTENAFINSLIESAPSIRSVWLGLVITQHQNTYYIKWADNSSIDYLNNIPSQVHESYCITIDPLTQLWHEDICTGKWSYVCETFAISCPDDSLQSIKNPKICYKAYNEKMNWTSANAKCAENGDIFGQLASIHSYSDNLIITILTEHFRHDGPDGHGDTAWIGGLYNNSTAVWEWSDKSSFDYTNWLPGLNSTNGFCVDIGYEAKWQTEDCKVALPFACSMFINYISHETLTTPAEEHLLTCPENATQGTIDPNICYLAFFGSTQEFEGSKELCEQNNGTLPIIQNFQQNLFVTSLMNYDFDFWIGGIYIDDTWKWLDGNNFTYTNWAQNEPNTTSGFCVYASAIDGKWNVGSCENPMYTLCKINAVKPRLTTRSFETTKKSQTMKSESSSPSFTTTQDPRKNQQLPTKWFIIGGTLFVFAALILISYMWLKSLRRKTIYRSVLENLRIKFLEVTELEMQLSHDERLKWQLNPKNVTIDYNKILGKGSNATVYEATIKDVNNVRKNAKILHYLNSTVALKLPTTFDAEETETFVRELDALIKLGSHSNIITFYGWSLFGEIPALITEEAHQNLLTYVKSLSEKTLPLKKFLSILWQISQALEHVAAFSMIHRDVACRNILLTEGNMAKLADFGLCCDSDESYRATLQKRFPLKWLSIEALVEKLFSEKSDVWSFGVICYEMFTFGSVPYQDLSNQEMVEFLQAHQRLEKPEIAPDAIYDLMLSCWNENPLERPCFTEISTFLRTMLEQETAGYGYLTLENESMIKNNAEHNSSF